MKYYLLKAGINKAGSGFNVELTLIESPLRVLTVKLIAQK